MGESPAHAVYSVALGLNRQWLKRAGDHIAPLLRRPRDPPGLLARVDPEEGEALIHSDGVAPMERRGRKMAGWLRVESSALGVTAELETWVRRSVAYARSLPPKG